MLGADSVGMPVMVFESGAFPGCSVQTLVPGAPHVEDEKVTWAPCKSSAPGPGLLVETSLVILPYFLKAVRATVLFLSNE